MRYTKCYRSEAAWDDYGHYRYVFMEHNLAGMWEWLGIRCSI